MVDWLSGQVSKEEIELNNSTQNMKFPPLPHDYFLTASKWRQKDDSPADFSVKAG